MQGCSTWTICLPGTANHGAGRDGGGSPTDSDGMSVCLGAEDRRYGDNGAELGSHRTQSRQKSKWAPFRRLQKASRVDCLVLEAHRLNEPGGIEPRIDKARLVGLHFG